MATWWADGILETMFRFQSLDVWQSARETARLAYGLTLMPWSRMHRSLGDQIRRAAGSIPANLAEGYGLGTRAQLIRCARMALGSAYELRTHLELAAELELVAAKTLEPVLRSTERTVSLLIGLLRGLHGRTPH